MDSMRTARSLGIGVAWAVIAAALSCSGDSHDPGRRVVATVGGDKVTVAQVQAYLEANLILDPAADPLPPRDLARVKSRLFDDYLDGEILAHEARRRGLAVSDAELNEYLGPDAPAQAAARDVARRDLLIQKLRESVVRADVTVDPAAIEAWLAAHPQQNPSELPGRLRTLRFASYPEAMRVRTEIVNRKLSFEQAHAAYGADALADTTHDADLGAFPSHIATAIKALAPGQVSQPLPFESSVLLFLLDPPEDPAVARARRIEEARHAVALEKSQEVADKLLNELRKSTRILRHEDELTFPYVAEANGARTE
jgi:parvulin-like peptidyl-prolyl isomerase